MPDDFFICMPDDGHKLRHIYATIYHYIGKLEQDDSFLPSIGVYRIEDESQNVSTMCNNAQIAASSVVGKIGNRICYFESGMTKKIELKQCILGMHDMDWKITNLSSIFSPNVT